MGNWVEDGSQGITRSAPPRKRVAANLTGVDSVLVFATLNL